MASACNPNFSDYQQRQAGVGLLSCIPFIGQSFAGFIPPVPNHQGDLIKAQNLLQTETTEWQTDITGVVDQNTQNIQELIDLLLGPQTNPGTGYIQVAIDYSNEPIRERSILNTVNITFIGLLLSIVIYYIVTNKG